MATVARAVLPGWTTTGTLPDSMIPSSAAEIWYSPGSNCGKLNTPP